MANSADWHHFNTFPSWEDTVPHTTGVFNTWKTVLPWTPVNILAICTGLNHEFILSELAELVAVANTTYLLHLRTFPSVEDTLPLTLRFFNTWKNSSLMNSSQHFAHLHWINSWIETFWAHCSGKFTVWLHLGIFSPMEDALPQTTSLQGSSTSGKPVLP